MRLASLALVGLGLALALPAAAEGPFRPVEAPAEVAGLEATTVRASAVRPFHFDARLFAEALKDVAFERANEVGTPSTLLELPHPDGSLALFRVIESPVMAPELAAKFPEIRTFRGEGVDDPTASVRFELSPRGFSAMVLSAFGAWYVEPWSRQNRDTVASFHRRDALRDPRSPFECQGPDAHDSGEESGVRSETRDLGPAPMPLASVGPTLRTYRLALATTGEYSVAVCGTSPTKACVAAELVVAVNRVTGIYEREVAVRMTLVAGNDAVIYLDGTRDPYTNNSGGAMLGENQSNLDAVIGSANYDFGHVFSTGGGGVAYLRVICSSSSKAGGVTGSSNPTGDAFWVDYVAHEMGHQFGGNHTFNGKQGSCNGNRASSAAYEPGSGSTIMAYAGICGSQDLQPHSDPYFHGKSFDEIVAHVTTGGGASCAASTATSNSAPTVEAGAAYTIPSQTPFALTGSATDPESDSLTFGWEEFDLGTIEAAPPLVDDGSRPIFRSFNPTVGPTRVFPKLADILAGTTTYGETMPATTRTMTFRLTARDNRGGGGGVNSDTTTVTSRATAGPFAITAPASAVSWPAASTQTVTWNVAGTNLTPISCANVAISLSTDSGASFPTTLLASTPNDGTQPVTLPNTQTVGATARVKVACVGNIFFAISRPSFTISAPMSPPTVSDINPSSGTTAGGTTVTITGTNFTGATAVTFGVTAATSYTVNSATQITATTPAHAAGTVDVAVTTPAGTATSTGGFAYVAPTPAIALVSPTSGPTAGGTPVTITGSSFVSGATVSIGGVAATSVVVASATSITAVTGAHAEGPVDVVVTNSGGTPGTLPAGYTYVAGPAGSAFYTVTPCRIVDTRNADGPFGGPILAASPAQRDFALASACGVPADAKVVSANVTVTGGTAAGSLRIYPADATLPVATTISFAAGKTRANNSLLLLSEAGGAGRVTVRNDSPGPVHLIVDVNGYFR
ncbi:MAG: IPT/TIG domain-containing protein [Holophagales bacterium]|nr:IPT/TIG domain-containing protein [Holophagales bacterium]